MKGTLQAYNQADSKIQFLPFGKCSLLHEIRQLSVAAIVLRVLVLFRPLPQMLCCSYECEQKYDDVDHDGNDDDETRPLSPGIYKVLFSQAIDH